MASGRRRPDYMGRTKKSFVKPSWLTSEDDEWVEESHRQMKLERPLWTKQADAFYEKYAGTWVAIRNGRVAHSSQDGDAFLQWLEQNDPERRRYLIRQVPDADAEFAC